MTTATMGTGQRLRRRCADCAVQGITWAVAGITAAAIALTILRYLGEPM